jgi:hypothetical protein
VGRKGIVGVCDTGVLGLADYSTLLLYCVIAKVCIGIDSVTSVEGVYRP